MQMIAQNLVFGLFVGGIYAVSAAGAALVSGVLKIVNIAHGGLVLYGAYISFWLFALLGIDPYVSLLLCIPTMFAAGLLLDRVIFRHLVRLDDATKHKNSLLVSFGLILILQNGAQQLFGADERTVQLGYSGTGLNLFGVLLPYTRLVSLFIALFTLVALHLFMRRTYPGKAIRAVADDGESAALVGIDVRRTYMFALAVGAALAGVAGSLVVIDYGIEPVSGLSWTLKALVVVTLAGTGSLLGVVPAALLLGLVEATSAMLLGSNYREVVGLVLFLLALVVRPGGLFGRV